MLNHTGTQTIETERLILRRFSHSDNTDMRSYWVSDPAVQSMYCEPVYTTEEEVRGLLTEFIDAYERDDCYRWAIILKSSGECIGQIAYFLVDNKNHFAEIEYCIGTKFQRKGYAPEAAKAVISYGFKTVNFHKVQICHHSNNEPSRKVIEKCGLVYEGTLRDYFYTDEGYIDRVYYSILHSEYEKRENLS